MKILLMSLMLVFVQVAPPEVAGRWQVKFTFAGRTEMNLVFDAKAKGDGTFLLLDTAADSKPEASPAPVRMVHCCSTSGARECRLYASGMRSGCRCLAGPHVAVRGRKERRQRWLNDLFLKHPNLQPREFWTKLQKLSGFLCCGQTVKFRIPV